MPAQLNVVGGCPPCLQRRGSDGGIMRWALRLRRDLRSCAEDGQTYVTCFTDPFLPPSVQSYPVTHPFTQYSGYSPCPSPLITLEPPAFRSLVPIPLQPPRVLGLDAHPRNVAPAVAPFLGKHGAPGVDVHLDPGLEAVSVAVEGLGLPAALEGLPVWCVSCVR